MNSSSLTSRNHALSIWQAGVDAVRSDRLVRDQVRVDGKNLRLGKYSVALDSFDRICIVGGGKAASGLAAGLEQALQGISQPLSGWVNVPEDCLLPTQSIHLHAARPAGVNEPTKEAVAGTAEILRRVDQLGSRDLCITLIAGGGSALLPAPVDGISLADKLAVTRLLSHNGADIHQLNTVRKQLSRIKGGGLAAACRAGQSVALIISDVLGDPLDIIASGPTVENSTTAADALTVLETFAQSPDDVPESVWKYLQQSRERDTTKVNPANETCTNLVLANNATALDACAVKARQLGYEPVILPTELREAEADRVATSLLQVARQRMRDSTTKPLCLLSGGEPVVRLAPSEVRGLGGRNQQLVLAVIRELAAEQMPAITLLSGGTDGEDGPTPAAGAVIWPDLVQSIAASQLNTDDYLQRNDAYSLLQSLGALVVTGPTHTNVCDVRVLLIP